MFKKENASRQEPELKQAGLTDEQLAEVTGGAYNTLFSQGDDNYDDSGATQGSVSNPNWFVPTPPSRSDLGW